MIGEVSILRLHKGIYGACS